MLLISINFDILRVQILKGLENSGYSDFKD